MKFEEYVFRGLLVFSPSFMAIVWKSIRLNTENFLEISAISVFDSLHAN